MGRLSEEFNQLWPTWTDETQGYVVVDVNIGWSVDKTFDMIWGPGSEFSAHVRDARNIRDYVEGPWVSDSKLQESMTGGEQDVTPPTPRSFSHTSEFEGNSRKVTFSQGSSGGLLKSAYTNEEVQRCILASESEKYVMHCCIASNAPYGDRIRILLNYRLTAGVVAGTCNFKLQYANHFIKSTNSMLKGVINTGVDAGVKKNFAVLKELMSEMVKVTDNLAEAPAETAAEGAAAAAIEEMAVHPAAMAQAAAHGLLNRLAALEAKLLDSAVRVTHGTQALKNLPLRHEDVAAGLSACLVGAILWVAVVLKSVVSSPLEEYCLSEGCVPGGGQMLCFLYSLTRLVDLPDSVMEVVGCCILLGTAQWAAARLFRLLHVRQVAPPHMGATATATVEDNQTTTEEAPAAPPEEQGDDGAQPSMKTEVHKQLSKLKDLSSSLVRDIATSSSDSIASVQRSIAHARATSTPTQAAAQPAVASGQAGLPPPAPVPPGRTGATPAKAAQGSLSSSRGPSPRVSPRVTAEEEVLPPAPPPPLAEVFENERYQPLRGWGHTWPGHLMPGDFSRWSLADDYTSSMVFSEVRPSLPEGFRWVDSEWEVDLQGLSEDAVDEDGWAYGLNWKWITRPPQAGMGKKKKFDNFVRQRRWTRSWAQVDPAKDSECVDDMKEPTPKKPQGPKEQKELQDGVQAAANLTNMFISGMGGMMKNPPASAVSDAAAAATETARGANVAGGSSSSFPQPSAKRPPNTPPHPSAIRTHAGQKQPSPLPAPAEATAEAPTENAPGIASAQLLTPGPSQPGDNDVHPSTDQPVAEVVEAPAVAAGELARGHLQADSHQPVEPPTDPSATEQHTTEAPLADGSDSMAADVSGFGADGSQLQALLAPDTCAPCAPPEGSDSYVVDPYPTMRSGPPGAGRNAPEPAHSVSSSSDVTQAPAPALYPEAGSDQGDAAVPPDPDSRKDRDSRQSLLVSSESSEALRVVPLGVARRTTGAPDPQDAPLLVAEDVAEDDLFAAFSDLGPPEIVQPETVLGGAEPPSAALALDPMLEAAADAPQDPFPAVADAIVSLGASDSTADSDITWRPHHRQSDGGRPLGPAVAAETGTSARPSMISEKDLDEPPNLLRRATTSPTGTRAGRDELREMSGAPTPEASHPLDDGSAKFMRIMKTGKLAGTLSDAGGKVVKAENVPRPVSDADTKQQLPRDASAALQAADAEVASWHKKAVLDMKRLAGEVNIDNMGGAAQRMGAEMNVAAKKLTGDVNGAARKLHGLFNRAGQPPAQKVPGDATKGQTLQEMLKTSNQLQQVPSVALEKKAD